MPENNGQQGSSFLAAGCLGSLLVAAGAAASRRAGKAARRAEAKEPSIPRPEDLLTSEKFPLYMGSTSGYFSRATKERHAITWTAKSPEVFEMPTTGWAIMNKGENLCYFRKKEQCIALGKQLRKMKIDNYKVYRIKKDGTVIFMHPADGVFPEKVTKGRVQVNGRPFSAGSNPQPSLLKWTKYSSKPYEADALTTMFVKARVDAWADQENLFPLPQPNLDGINGEYEFTEGGEERMLEALEAVEIPEATKEAVKTSSLSSWYKSL
jgi:photosystem I subunit 2